MPMHGCRQTMEVRLREHPYWVVRPSFYNQNKYSLIIYEKGIR